MLRPTKFLTRMSIFLVAVLVLVVLLRGALETAFMANVALNGVILAVLALGTVYAYRRVFALAPEIEWITAFKRQESAASSVTPRLMAPAASLLSADDTGAMRLSAMSMRSVLDGIASRLEETREMSRYLTGLLIFLGLLGTFWGLLGTIGAIGGTIQTLSVDGGDMTLMFDELKAGLEAPLSGMGTAFSSSLFGLAGSLVLGFMDLQASQAQTRFYNEVEDWLASVTKLSRGGDIEGGVASNPGAYTVALMEQTADGIEKLQRIMKQGEDARRDSQDTMTAIAQSLAGLADRLKTQEQSQARMQDASLALANAIDKLAAAEEKAPPPAAPPVVQPVIDEASKEHIRNLDVGIRRLIEEQARTSENLSDELKAELKLVARTIAAGFGNSGSMASGSMASGVTVSEPESGDA